MRNPSGTPLPSMRRSCEAPSTWSAPTQGVLPHRLPALGSRQIPDDQLAMAEAQPSGVRLAFRTAATAIELDVLPTKMAYAGRPASSRRVYDLLVDGRLAGRATATGGNLRTIGHGDGSADTPPGPVGTVRFSGLPARARTSRSGCPTTRSPSWSRCAPTPPPQSTARPRPQDLAAPRQLDQPRLERREPDARPGRRWPHPSAVSSWSTSGSAAVPCSTRSPRGPCATPPPT